MRGESELRLYCPAQSSYVAPIRHALGAFLEALQFESSVRDDVTTAAGEALTNAVEHAYARCEEPVERDLQLYARVESQGKVSVEVWDHGSFIARTPVPGRGFGLRIIAAIARQINIDTSRGTCVSMTFDAAASSPKR